MDSINLYNSLKQEFTELISEGSLHHFSVRDVHYIYLRAANSSFRVDELANRTLLALREGRSVNQEDLLSFYTSWREIRSMLTGKAKSTQIQAYFHQSENIKDFEEMQMELELLLNASNQLQVIIQLSDGSWEASEIYLNAILSRIRDILSLHKLKVAVEVRIPFELVSKHSQGFLSREGVLTVVQVHAELYNEDIVAQVLQLGIKNIETIGSYFPWTKLDDKIKNVCRLDPQIPIGDSKVGLLTHMVEYLQLNGISESVQNGYRIFSLLTTNGIVDTKILSFRNRGMMSNTCKACWAQHTCWSSRNYEAFSAHPNQMVLNRESCFSTYSIMENMFDILNTHQERIFIEENSNKSYQLSETETIELINP